MDYIMASLVLLVIWLILFLIFRGLMLWYWKINEIVKLLNSINDKIDKHNNHI